MEALTEAMRAAEGITNQYDYIDTVKAIFRRAVTDLDPSAELEDTGYFNHSAVPDYVLHWTKKKQDSRRVYLRRSYDEIAGGRDMEHLSRTDPVIISLNERSGTGAAESEIRRSTSEGTSDTLITGGAALETMGSGQSRPGEGGSPLAGMLSGRLLRSGKGLVDAAQAERLVSVQGSIADDVATSFTAPAVQALRDAVELVAAAADPERPAPVSRSALSLSEARTLLPWLLRRENGRSDAEFWANVGSRVDLTILEALAPELDGLDISALVVNSWTNWKAKRGYLGLAVADERGFDLSPEPRWFMNDRLLTCFVGSDALRFSTYGQALKGRGDVSSAVWERIEPALGPDMSLVAITLRGVDRSMTLDANELSDLRADVRRVLDTITDSFFIDKLTLLLGAIDEYREVEVDLGERLVMAHMEASLRDLAVTLARVVAYTRPIEIDG